MKQFFPLFKNYAHLFLTLPVLFIGLYSPQPAGAELVDKILAVVNDDVITLSEVEEASVELYRSLTKKNSGKSPFQVLNEARENTLNTMISQLLIEQKAKQSNVAVSEKEIDAAYENMRIKSSFDPAEFRNKLEESGMSEELYRKNLKMQILQSKLVNYDVRSKIIITEDMILDYYDDNYTIRVDKGSYYLLQMGFSWKTETSNPEDLAAGKQTTYKRAERVFSLVKGGQDFQELAKKFSDLPSASDGGDIGTFTLDEMAPGMRSAVAPLKPGQLSKIIETSAGYQFFKLLSGADNDIVITSSYEAAKNEIREKLYQEKLKEAYAEWVKELEENAYIQKL